MALASFAPRWRCAYRGYGWVRCLALSPGVLPAGGLWHWRRLLPGGAVLTGATGGCGVWLDRLAHCLRGACGTGVVCSPVALRLPGLRMGAVSGLIAWRIACGGPVALAPFAPRWRCAYRGYGHGAVLGIFTWRIACGGPVALALFVPRWRCAYRGYGRERCWGFSSGVLPAVGPVALASFAPRWRCAYRGYVGAVPGFIAWRIARGGPVALAPFAPRWRYAYRGYGWERCLALSPGVLPAVGPVALALFVPRWRFAYRGYGWGRCLALSPGASPAGGLWHWRRLFPGGAALTGATGGAVLGIFT